jgi:hypothetical protein
MKGGAGQCTLCMALCLQAPPRAVDFAPCTCVSHLSSQRACTRKPASPKAATFPLNTSPAVAQPPGVALRALQTLVHQSTMVCPICIATAVGTAVAANAPAIAAVTGGAAAARAAKLAFDKAQVAPAKPQEEGAVAFGLKPKMPKMEIHRKDVGPR